VDVPSPSFAGDQATKEKGNSVPIRPESRGSSAVWASWPGAMECLSGDAAWRAPWGRTCEVLADLVGVHLSRGTLAGLIEANRRAVECRSRADQGSAEQQSDQSRDETGCMCLNRQHVSGYTRDLDLPTHARYHAFHTRAEVAGVETRWRSWTPSPGISVHDCWATYFRYSCQHALCLVHILRGV